MALMPDPYDDGDVSFPLDGQPTDPFEAHREMWRRGAPLDDLYPDGPFALRGPVGPYKQNRQGDVAKVQSLLHDAGYMDANQTDGPTGLFSRALLEAPIKRFQSDQGLQVDGLLEPGGETIGALESLIGPHLARSPLDPAPANDAGGPAPAVKDLPRRHAPGRIELLPLAANDAAAQDAAARPLQLAANETVASDGAPDVPSPAPAASNAAKPKPNWPTEPKIANDPVTEDYRDKTFDDYLKDLAPREGGDSNHASDTGGPTRKGISQKGLTARNKLWPNWGLPQKVDELTDAQVTDIYRREFYDEPQIARFAFATQALPSLAAQTFDIGVHSGPATAARWVQKETNRVLGTELDVDGKLGPETRDALAKATPLELAQINNAIAKRREAFLREIVRKKPKQRENLDGWIKRARSFAIPEQDPTLP
jgi:lysozyme family protein